MVSVAPEELRFKALVDLVTFEGGVIPSCVYSEVILSLNFEAAMGRVVGEFGQGFFVLQEGFEDIIASYWQVEVLSLGLRWQFPSVDVVGTF
jgi:hypothetical protein